VGCVNGALRRNAVLLHAEKRSPAHSFTRHPVLSNPLGLTDYARGVDQGEAHVQLLQQAVTGCQDAQLSESSGVRQDNDQLLRSCWQLTNSDDKLANSRIQGGPVQARPDCAR